MLVHGGPNQQNSDIITGHTFEGEACAIALAQLDPGSVAAWQLFIFCECDQGTFFLGSVVTNTIAIDTEPARVVAYASCPGARSFKVIAKSPTEGETAEVWILPGKCCGGGAPFGVSLPPGGGTGPQPPPSGGGT